MRIFLSLIFILLLLNSCDSSNPIASNQEVEETEHSPQQIEPFNPENRNEAIANLLGKSEASTDKFVSYYYEGLKNGRSGTGTIRLYLNDLNFLGYFVDGENWGQIEKWEKISGIKPFTKQIDYDKPYDIDNFNHLNPAFVDWFAENMIPASTEKIGKQTAQAVYSSIGYRFCRQLLASHDYLEKQGFDKVVEAYKAKVAELNHEDMDPQLLDYLYKTYSIPTAQTPVPEQYFATSCFDGGVACGFWIRRRIDGSDKAIWKMLEKLMQDYDADFMENYRESYKYFYPQD